MVATASGLALVGLVAVGAFSPTGSSITSDDIDLYGPSATALLPRHLLNQPTNHPCIVYVCACEEQRIQRCDRAILIDATRESAAHLRLCCRRPVAHCRRGQLVLCSRPSYSVCPSLVTLRVAGGCIDWLSHGITDWHK
jgi:hypothetical protein